MKHNLPNFLAATLALLGMRSEVLCKVLAFGDLVQGLRIGEQVLGVADPSPQARDSESASQNIFALT